MIETVPSDKSNRFEIIALFVIATAAFIYFTGGAILNPTNVKWLYWGDPATSYLGWQFFRDTALLQFPIGKTPNFGSGFSSSILYTDSIPLIAIPLKYFSFLLPHGFQYFGFWIYTTFILQVFFASRVLAYWVKDSALRVLGSTLFLIAPIFLYRLVHNGYGHIGFTNQFLILWAVLLILQKSKSVVRWSLILCFSVLLSVGILPMVLMLFVAYVAIDAVKERTNQVFIPNLVLIIIPLSLTVLVLWAAGGTMVSSTTSEGFGTYRSTLASLIDPSPPLSFSWSQIAPQIDSPGGTEEGFSFIGISGFLLFPFMLLFLKHKSNLRNMISLLVAGILMLILSLSNVISFGNRVLFTYQVPTLLAPIFETLRSSGRFTWPAIYLILVFGTVGFIETTTKGRGSTASFVLILSMVFIQLIDMASATTEIRERFNQPGFTASLTDPRWNELAKQYDHLIAVPPLNNDPGWFELALLANTWGMTSNAAYYGRIDENKLVNESARLQRDVDEQRFDSNTLYVITNYPPNPASPKLIDQFSGAAANTAGIHVYELDGFVVVAP
jgi:hypothetical protein